MNINNFHKIINKTHLIEDQTHRGISRYIVRIDDADSIVDNPLFGSDYYTLKVIIDKLKLDTDIVDVSNKYEVVMRPNEYKFDIRMQLISSSHQRVLPNEAKMIRVATFAIDDMKTIPIFLNKLGMNLIIPKDFV